MGMNFKDFTITTLTDIGLDPCFLEQTVNGINFYYRSRWSRYYHNQDHIEYMVRQMHDLSWNSSVLAFAILMHDAYYRVEAPPGYNEEISRRLANKILERCTLLDANQRLTVNGAILATARYMTNLDGIEGDRTICERICDLDLSSLAREPYSDFVGQQKSIMMEHGTNDLSKSASFLKSLYQARGDGLYYTKEGKELWLNKAVKNIQTFCKEYDTPIDVGMISSESQLEEPSVKTDDHQSLVEIQAENKALKAENMKLNQLLRAAYCRAAEVQAAQLRRD